MDLSQLTLAEDAQTDGAWIAPRFGEALEFKCIAKTPKFKAREVRAMRNLIKEFGEAYAIPTSAEAAQVGPLYFAEGLVKDVRGLSVGERPVTFNELPGLIVQPKFAPLFEALKLAVDLASSRVQADADAALGKSAPSSATVAATPSLPHSSEMPKPE